VVQDISMAVKLTTGSSADVGEAGYEKTEELFTSVVESVLDATRSRRQRKRELDKLNKGIVERAAWSVGKRVSAQLFECVWLYYLQRMKEGRFTECLEKAHVGNTTPVTVEWLSEALLLRGNYYYPDYKSGERFQWYVSEKEQVALYVGDRRKNQRTVKPLEGYASLMEEEQDSW